MCGQSKLINSDTRKSSNSGVRCSVTSTYIILGFRYRIYRRISYVVYGINTLYFLVFGYEILTPFVV